MRQIRVLRRLQVKLIHGLDCTKAMPTFVPAAAHHTPVSSLRVGQSTMATNPVSYYRDNDTREEACRLPGIETALNGAAAFKASMGRSASEGGRIRQRRT